MPPDSNGDPLKIAVLSDVHGNLPGVQGGARSREGRGLRPRSGSWATWWATARSRTSAWRWRPRTATSAWPATTISGCSGRSTSPTSPPTPPRRRAGRAITSARGTLEFLGSLKPQRDGEAIGLWHASPRDPVWEYVLSIPQAGECMDAMDARVGAVGHTHVACWFTQQRGRPHGRCRDGGPAPGPLGRASGCSTPGSVGQPRDGDPRAAWLALDLEQWTADWRRVEYPIARGRGCNRRGRAPKQPRPAAIHRAVTQSTVDTSPPAPASPRWPGRLRLSDEREGRAEHPAGRGAPQIDQRLDEVQRRYDGRGATTTTPAPARTSQTTRSRTIERPDRRAARGRGRRDPRRARGGLRAPRRAGRGGLRRTSSTTETETTPEETVPDRRP